MALDWTQPGSAACVLQRVIPKLDRDGLQVWDLDLVAEVDSASVHDLRVMIPQAPDLYARTMDGAGSVNVQIKPTDSDVRISLRDGLECLMQDRPAVVQQVRLVLTESAQTCTARVRLEVVEAAEAAQILQGLGHTLIVDVQPVQLSLDLQPADLGQIVCGESTSGAGFVFGVLVESAEGLHTVDDFGRLHQCSQITASIDLDRASHDHAKTYRDQILAMGGHPTWRDLVDRMVQAGVQTLSPEMSAEAVARWLPVEPGS